MERTEIHLGSHEYPEALAWLDRPPQTLYCMGDQALLKTEGLAVIGARKATPYGRAAARILAGWAAGHGVPIISGAAIGCDQEAHNAALDEGGPTVAVLGCGADVDYPRGAHDLLSTIRRRGLVVSLEPWGTEPRRWKFIHRNHLIAGLSRAVLVVEASLPSGTFSTADFALECGRAVFAVPGSIFAPESRGANRLIRQGASPITDPSDLASELEMNCSAQLAFPECDAQPVLAATLSQPLRPDDLARELNTSVVEITRELGRLEREGLVARYPDGRYGPCVGSVRTIQSADDETTHNH